MQRFKQLAKTLPIVGPLARFLHRLFKGQSNQFRDSTSYWINRYDSGGNSGDGSYNKLAEFKAEIINEFLRQNDIDSVIEFGCGDGNQLRLINYPSYVGYDISPKAISKCREIFKNDHSKRFKIAGDYDKDIAELTLSLDVIYHLIEDQIFADYMHRLFNASTQFVLIYSSNTDTNAKTQAPHVKHRQFTDWVDKHITGWTLKEHIPNKYPFTGETKTSSSADFFVYEIATPKTT